MPEVGLVIDLSSAVPPYEQVRLQLSGLVAAGHLRSGDRLPSVRALAADLGLAVNTIGRAYRELEADGVVTTRRRTGTVVAEGVRSNAEPVRRAAHQFVQLTKDSGLTDDELLDAIRGALMSEKQAE